ncbi:hypothetical protein LINGRAHAP2_LOCUS24969, partial [Linum grandiflorum]
FFKTSRHFDQTHEKRFASPSAKQTEKCKLLSLRLPFRRLWNAPPPPRSSSSPPPPPFLLRPSQSTEFGVHTENDYVGLEFGVLTDTLFPQFSHRPGIDAEFVSELKSKTAAPRSLSLISAGGSGSCISSSSELLPTHKRIVAVVARGYDMKLKISRKKRSKVYWSSMTRHKPVHVVYRPPSKSDSIASSCLSSNSAAASQKSQTKNTDPSFAGKRRKKQGSGSSLIKHRAESILKLLASGSSTEVRIRQLLGNSPDTSKALRMLLRRNEVKRSGTGGRQDPYIYKVPLCSFTN